MSAGKPGLFSSLRHRDYAFFIGAFTTSAIGSWAYNVALAVWLIDETGSTGWVAAATVCRFLPALLFSAYGGVLAERVERMRLMVSADLLCTAVMGLMAAGMFLGVHPALILVTAGLTSTLGTAYEPAAAAMTPQLVTERDLGSANALRNTVDNVCVIAGPGLGALLLVVADPWLAVTANAATFLASALLLTGVKQRSVPVDVTEGGEAGPLRQMLVGIRTIVGEPTAATLVGFSVVATMVFGMDTVQFVVLSRDVLGTGAEGYGYLLAGLGVGGIAAAGLVTRMERLPKLGWVILAGIGAYCLPTLLFLVVDQPAIGFVIQVVRGAGTLVVDVLAITALQRSVPTDRLGRVFGAFGSLCLLAVLAGSSIMPPIIGVVGLDGSLWFAGLVIPALCLFALPWLRRMDEESAVRRVELAPKVALLTACDLFASVSEGTLDELAGTAEYVDVEAGAVVIRQGETADAFYVVVSGTFAATSEGEAGTVPLSEMTEGAYFGEIGLIEGIPRTATVTAATAGRLLRIEGEAFVAALTQAAPSAALLEGAAMRLRRTHPSRALARAGLSSDEQH